MCVCRILIKSTYLLTFQLDETVNWPSIMFEYGEFPRPGLDYELFGFELGRFGRISADGRAFTLPPEYIHIDRVCNSLFTSVNEGCCEEVI